MKKIQLVVLYSLLLATILSVFTSFKSFNKKEQYTKAMSLKLVKDNHQFNALNCASCHGCNQQVTVKNDSLYLENIFFVKHDSIILVKENEVKNETVIKSQL